MEFKNDLGLVGKIAAHSVMSGKYKDKDGNIKEILPVGPGNSLDFDQFREDIGAFGGGAGGTDTDEEHPGAGVDYYAGSLANGEITERTLEWSGTDNPTKDLTVTFIDDPGTKIFGQYDGITVLGHIRKVALNKGVIGNTSEVDLNYDSENAKKDGYYTTTAPYPLYIKTESLPAGQTANVPINGIGEGLANSNEKVPELNLTFNSDKTMTINHVMGYSNDGDSSGASGFNYYFVIDKIATFSTQAAVAQLPPSVNLFSGSANGDIQLTGPTKYHENDMDGLEITLSDYLTLPGQSSPRSALSEFGLNKTIRIPKEHLINNSSFKVDYDYVPLMDPSNGESYPGETKQSISLKSKQGDYWLGENDGYTHYIYQSQTDILIKDNNIDVEINRFIGGWSGIPKRLISKGEYVATVLKVTTYKD